jgi:hypothetical protein
VEYLAIGYTVPFRGRRNMHLEAILLLSRIFLKHRNILMEASSMVWPWFQTNKDPSVQQLEDDTSCNPSYEYYQIDYEA